MLAWYKVVYREDDGLDYFQVIRAASEADARESMARLYDVSSVEYYAACNY